MSRWIFFNPNPVANRTEDCTVRALVAAIGVTWDEAHDMLADRSKQMGLMMHSNVVLGSILRRHGFHRAILPECPECVTAEEFCREHPHGVFVLFFGSTEHVATAIDGRILDSWDSSDEIVAYFWYEEEI